MKAAPDGMGERAKRMPPSPRLVMKGNWTAVSAIRGRRVKPAPFDNVVLLPQVDDEWQPIQDRWVLPGRRVLTTEDARALAASCDLEVSIIN